MSNTTTSPSKLKKALNILRYRSLPYGLVSVSYLQPRLSNAEQMHRSILGNSIPKLPRPLAYLFNFWLYLRWLAYSAWKISYLSVKQHGPKIKASHNIGLIRQFIDVIALALLHTIPASAYYGFKLYSRRSDHAVKDYVYNQELEAFHLMRNGKPRHGVTHERQLLGDKFEWSKRMQSSNINVDCGELLPIGSQCSQLIKILDLIVGSPAAVDATLFCKPRSAAHAEGAFRLSRTSSGTLELRLLSGNILKGDDAESYIKQQLTSRDYLAQNCFENHETLQALVEHNDEAVTVRIITEKAEDHIKLYCAYAEIPVKQDERKFYCPIQVDVESGALLTDTFDRLSFDVDDALLRVKAGARNVQLPHWQACKNTAVGAHAHFDCIYAIAWDLIITPTGPVMLEGNANWRIDLPQQLCGGLLKKQTPL